MFGVRGLRIRKAEGNHPLRLPLAYIFVYIPVT